MNYLLFPEKKCRDLSHSLSKGLTSIVHSFRTVKSELQKNKKNCVRCLLLEQYVEDEPHKNLEEYKRFTV
jgi:hypothetical protein